MKRTLALVVALLGCGSTPIDDAKKHDFFTNSPGFTQPSAGGGGGLASLTAGSFSATQRVLGRNTAGAGTAEEVTASQLHDWLAAVDGSILTRTSGSWAAIANVTSGGGDLVFGNDASPTTPSANTLKLLTQSYATKELPVALGPTAAKIPLGPHLGHRSWFNVVPNPASTTISLLGTAATVTGTTTARVISSTNLSSSTIRVGAVSAAGANSVGGYRGAAAPVWRGNAAGLGGFYCSFRWFISDAAFVSTGQTFVGLWATTTAPTDVGPETLTNIFGIGNTNGDTQLQLYAGGSAAQARTALGANFPANTTNVDVYEVILYAAPNDSQISYQVNRLNTGNTTSGTVSAAANLFSSTTFVGWQMWRSNGGTATAVGIDVISAWCDFDV